MRILPNQGVENVSCRIGRFFLMLLFFWASILPASCGGGTEEEIDPQLLPQPKADLGTIVFLDVTDENGGHPAELHAGHPIIVTVHIDLLEGVSPDQLTSVQVGLMKKLAPEEDHANGRACYLGALHHPGKGLVGTGSGPVVLSAKLHIPETCLVEDETSDTFNVWVALNPATELDYPEGTPVPQEELNTQFFTAEGHDTEGTDRNSLCLDRNKTPGCVLDLTVTRSPGHNVELEELSVASSVLVLPWDACQRDAVKPAAAVVEADLNLLIHGSLPDDGQAATDEFHNPLVELLGQGEAVELKAALCPRDDDGECNQGTDYLPLLITGRSLDENGKPDGKEADSVQVTELVVGQDHSFALDLHVDPQSNLCSNLVGQEDAAEDWSRFSLFNLRVCAEVPFEEQGHGDDELEDNCRVVPLRVVIQNDTGRGQADFLDFDHAWDRSTGNDVVNLNASAGTINHFNLDGAYSHSYANAGLGGWLNISFIDINFEGLAYVAILGSGVEAHVDIFGYREWGYESWVADGADTVNVAGDFNFAKEYCLTYNYGIAGIGLNASLCASGSAGVEPTATIKAVEAAGTAPFDSSTRIGDIAAHATPKTEFDLSASAYLDIAVAKGGITGTLVLLHLDAPIDAKLQWGLIDQEGSPALVVISDVVADLNCNVLAGDISVWVELYEPSWCWCDHWYCPDWVPCFDWDYVVNEPLVSFAGYGFSTNIIDTGVQQTTLGF